MDYDYAKRELEVSYYILFIIPPHRPLLVSILDSKFATKLGKSIAAKINFFSSLHLQAARQNKKLTEVKLQQFEDTYHNAKAAFDEVTDKLYDELPTLFDR